MIVTAKSFPVQSDGSTLVVHVRERCGPSQERPTFQVDMRVECQSICKNIRLTLSLLILQWYSSPEDVMIPIVTKVVDCNVAPKGDLERFQTEPEAIANILGAGPD